MGCTYKVEGSDLTGRGEVRKSRNGIRDFANNLPPVVKSEDKGFIVQSIRAFFYIDTPFCAHGKRSRLCKLVHIEMNSTAGNLCGFITHEAAPGEFKELGLLIPVYEQLA